MKTESREEILKVVREVSTLVSSMAGIQLGEKQSFMVESRLKSRMMRLGCATYEAYVSYLKKNLESESQALLSLMTTHHTYFFREFPHFEFLLNSALLPMIEDARARSDKTIRVWSAACSRGQEVYSLAMFFDFHLRQAAPDVNFEIWGTDVDAESVRYAENGVYKNDELKTSPAMYVGANWSRGQGEIREFVRIKKSIQQHCKFGVVNLLDCDKALTGKTFDLIFCRNVFIYFDQNQVQSISKTFLKHLTPRGHLVLGVSESLHGSGLAVQSVGPSIYRHKDAPSMKTGVTKTAPSTKAKPASPAIIVPVVQEKKVLDILCVDDSPAILTLLSKILTPENGFRVTKTAPNGQAALDLLKSGQFDAITLDLHMPELDGVGFLKAYKGPAPVLVVSSVNRDDTSLAQEAIRLGAKDYVEKPSLQNLAQAGNEIRSKIRTIYRATASVSSSATASSSVSLSSSSKTSAAASTPSKPTATAATARPVATATSGAKKKVLIVDDSKTIRHLLKEILSQSADLEVVGEAEDPTTVEALIEKLKPDVITLDIHMPKMDGVTLLKKIFPKYHLPTVMISSISREEGPAVLNALEAGAVDYIQKPEGGRFSENAQLICDRVRTAAFANTKSVTPKAQKLASSASLDGNSLVVIGASTGGTEALRYVLESLPDQIPPILIVQHIPPVFSAAFAKRLNDLVRFDVREAKDGDEVKPNQVLIAPGGTQMGVRVADGKTFVTVRDEAPVNRHKPSVDYLFRSVANAKIGPVVAGVLTGMGADGARELKTLRDLGAKTFAQDEATSVVYGMPKEAFRLGGAMEVVPLGRVAQTVLKFSSRSAPKKDVA